MRTEELKTRLLRAALMGFYLSKNANDYIHTIVKTDFEIFKGFIKNYNDALHIPDFTIRIYSEGQDSWFNFLVLGVRFSIKAHEFFEILSELDALILKNLQDATTSYRTTPLDVYDLYLLTPLEMTGRSTMGDTYRASFNRNYNFDFVWLYRVSDAH